MDERAEEFWYGIDGERYGPVELEELRRLVREGELGPDDFIWDEERDDWRPVREYAALLLRPMGSTPKPESPPEAEKGDEADFDLPDPPSSRFNVAFHDPREGGESAGREPVSGSYEPPETWPRIYREPTPVEYGGFGLRLAAQLLDGIILFPFALMWAFAVTILRGIEWGVVEPTVGDPYGLGAGDPGASLLIQVGLILMPWIYESLFLSSRWQATPGKRVMGLIVTDEQGHRLTLGRAVLRHFGKIVNQFGLLLPYLLILFDRRKQGLHDKLASTLVIKL